MTVKAETIIRTVILAITLANQILTVCGANPLPFSEDELYSLFSAIATAAVSIWAWWKNNSFTKAAIEADEVLEKLKSNENT